MKNQIKTITPILLVILFLGLIIAFKPIDSNQEILTIRVTETTELSGGLWKSNIIISEPHHEAKKIDDLGKLPKDNISNLTKINNTLNQVTENGWKLTNVTSAALQVQQIVTIYTFTK